VNRFSHCKVGFNYSGRILVVADSSWAILLLLTILTLFPAQAHTQDANTSSLQRAVTAISEGQLPQAEATLNSILAVTPRDPDALNLLGVVRAQQQRNAEAESLFRRALAVAPSHVGAHVNLGELYFTTGRTQQAIQILTAAYKLAPERPDVNLHLATIYESRGEHAAASEHLHLIPRSEANAEYFQLLLKVLLNLRRIDEARSLAAEYRDANSVNPDEAAQFAMALARGGLSDAALDLLATARTRNPDSFSLLYTLGVINGERKHYEEAQRYLTEALRAKPADVPTLRALARVVRARGELEKALSYLVQARRLSPDDPAVLYDFGVTALRMDLYLDALPALDKIHRSYPRELNFTYALAAARFRNGENAAAVNLLKGYVVARPQDPAGFYLLGAALHSLKQYAEAETVLERSLKLKADVDTEYVLGLVQSELGNRVAAIESLQQVIRTKPDHPGAHTALGTAYREQGNLVEARTTLERAVTLDPHDLRAHYQLGLVYAKLGDKEAAQRMLTRADELRGEQRKQETVVLKLVDMP
jgi:tetratricopeptide (TPR) repeat protein